MSVQFSGAQVRLTKQEIIAVREAIGALVYAGSCNAKTRKTLQAAERADFKLAAALRKTKGKSLQSPETRLESEIE